MDVATYTIYNLVSLFFFQCRATKALGPMHTSDFSIVFFLNFFQSRATIYDKYIYIYIYRTWGKKCAPCAPGLIRIHRSLTRVLFSSSPSFFFFFLRTVGCNCITNFARYYKGRGQFSCFLFSWWGGRERAIGEQENVNIGAQRGQGG